MRSANCVISWSSATARLNVPIHYVKAHASLAQLYDTMGRRADADALYRKVLSYWGDADVPLAIVAGAKARIGPD